MTWAERHPHPGEAPPKPSDEEPTDAELLGKWWSDRYQWNKHVMEVRQHEVAVALDRLEDQVKEFGASPVATIAMNLGASFLDGTIGQPVASRLF